MASFLSTRLVGRTALTRSGLFQAIAGRRAFSAAAPPPPITPTVPFAQRMNGVDQSGLRKIFDLAATLKDPINLSIGQPDFDVPDVVKEACMKAIRDGKNGYPPSAGIPELRRAVLDQYEKEFKVRPESSIITCGASGAMTLAFQLLVNPGDEVLISDPYFVSYKTLTLLNGGVPVLYDTDKNFEIDPDVMEKKITKKTKMIVIVSPGNPTGACLTARAVRRIAEIAKKHNLVILSDESYERFIYDDTNRRERLAASFGALAPERTLTVSSMSKSVGMTGWRVGWALGPEAWINRMTTLQQFTFVCSPSANQYGALAAVGLDMSKTMEVYKRRRELLVNGLRGLGYEVPMPKGAFYAFAKAPALYENATAFVHAGLKQSLLTVPGNSFSRYDTHFRMSYATTEHQLKRALEVLGKLIKA